MESDGRMNRGERASEEAIEIDQEVLYSMVSSTIRCTWTEDREGRDGID